jgi:hypothetical protein
VTAAIDKTMTMRDFRARQAQERRNSRRAAGQFVSAIVEADSAALYRGAQAMGMTFDGWARGVRAASRLTGLSEASRRLFLDFWIEEGDTLRGATPSDLDLIRVLRALLPPYEGPAMRLYRGEGARNRRRRTYGMAWSAEREIAEGFFRGNAALYAGGTVLLEAHVPADAIICSPHVDGGAYDEVEYLVDRRRLRTTPVRVIDRIWSGDRGLGAPAEQSPLR